MARNLLGLHHIWCEGQHTGLLENTGRTHTALCHWVIKKVSYSLRTVHYLTCQTRHNSGTRLTWTGSRTRKCGHPPGQTSFPSTSPYGPFRRAMCAQTHRTAPPSWFKPSRGYEAASARTSCGPLAYQQWNIWRLSFTPKVAMMSPSGVAYMCTCPETYMPKMFPIFW